MLTQTWIIALLLSVAAPAVWAEEPKVEAPAAPAEERAGLSTLDFANGLYARKMYAPAVAEYEKFIRDNPQSPETVSALFRAADCYYFSKNYNAAIVNFRSFINNYPTDKRTATARFRIGTSLVHLKNYRAAAGIFRRLSATATDTAVKSGALFYLGQSYAAEPALGNSLPVYAELTQKFPQSEYASYAGIAVGDQYLKTDQPEEALAAYKIAAANPNPPEIATQAEFKIAELYFRKKDVRMASSIYDRIYQRVLPAVSTDANAKKTAETALLGFFYSAAQSKDLNAATSRFEAVKSFLAGSDREPEILYLLAIVLAEHKKYDQALARLESVIAHPKKTPDTVERAYFKKAQVLVEQGKALEALAVFDALLAVNSKNGGRVYYEKALALESLKRNGEALVNYRAVLDKFPSSEVAKAALYRSALLQIQTRQATEARDSFIEFRSLYAQDENADEALLEIVQLDLDAKEFSEAATNAEKFLEQYPQSDYSPIVYYKLGVARTGLKQYPKAAEAFKKASSAKADSPVAAESLYGTATSFESTNSIAEATAAYEKLLKDHPQHELVKEAAPRLGYLYVQSGALDKAAALYKELYLNRADIELHSDVALWLIQVLLDRGEYVDVRKILDLLPTRYPAENLKHETQFYFGEAAMGLQDYAKATEAYKLAIQAKPDGPYVPHAQLGLGVAAVAQNDLIGAEKYFNETLRFEADLKAAARARYEIANLRLRAGAWQEAAKAFMLVAILYDDPKYVPPSLYKASECFLKLNQTDEATKAMQELRSRYPNSEWAKKAVS